MRVPWRAVRQAHMAAAQWFCWKTNLPQDEIPKKPSFVSSAIHRDKSWKYSMKAVKFKTSQSLECPAGWKKRKRKWPQKCVFAYLKLAVAPILMVCHNPALTSLQDISLRKDLPRTEEWRSPTTLSHMMTREGLGIELDLSNSNPTLCKTKLKQYTIIFWRTKLANALGLGIFFIVVGFFSSWSFLFFFFLF